MNRLTIEQEAREAGVQSADQKAAEKNAGVILAAGGLLWRDSTRGKELAVIHRARYGDWTLPKGKLDKEESWQDAAKREVEEETGCEAEVGSFAGCVCYTVEHTPKVVLFWNMSVETEREFQPNNEVDKIVWLSPQEALRKLDYPGERNLILDIDTVSNGSSSLWSRLKKSLFWSAERSRLAETIGPYRSEMEHFIRFRTGGETSSLWGDAALDLLNKAQQALDQGDAELGWRYFGSAQLMGIYGLTDSQLTMRAQAVLNEAEGKLGSWRKGTVKNVLEGDEKGELKNQISREELYYASRILQEHFTNLYRKRRIFGRQLNILQIVAFSAAAIWLLAVSPFLDWREIQIGNIALLVSVALFGIMGAAVSGILSIGRAQTEARIPEQLLTGMITLARPVIGAVASLAVFTFLASGLLQVGETTSALVLAVSFAAGFSERLVMRTVESVT